jgi:uncharacterized protein YbaA (DUF1428 family)
MTYVEGFIVPVPASKKDEYRAHADAMVPMLRECGVQRQLEAWGDDVPQGKVTDFHKSVQAQEGEDVVFAWFEYPDRAARDAANQKMMSDPRMEEVGATMPFDGKRMIMGGFQSIVDEGSQPGAYTDGFVVAVPEVKKDAYLAMAQMSAGVFREYGATRVVEAWEDDVNDGKVTDFRRSVLAEEGERIVFSWIEWPSREARDAGWQKVMADERMKPDHGNMPFDGKRMFWGGFRPVIDTAQNGAG